MRPTLRWYQSGLKNDIYTEWQNPEVRNVLAVAPTGTGKTVLMGSIGHDFPAGVAIAHRQELVAQISMALAREGLVHNLICSDSTRKAIQQIHVQETGRRWVDRNAGWHVAGVDTLVRHPVEKWMADIPLIMQDEAHHVLRHNKWGKAWKLFPNARGLGVTATPERADGHGLGSDASGVFDALRQTISMRELIDQGYLTDYIYVGDPDALKGMADQVHTSEATGDFNSQKLSEYFKANPSITGDVVASYLAHAPGKLGVTFAVDIDHANGLAAEYRRRGVPSEVLTGKTPELLRRSLLKRFAAREFLQLVSVDILGEGFDLPAIEVVSFARPTQSYSLFVQQWGRVLRLMLDKELLAVWEDLTVEQRLWYIANSRKPKAIILDHVGNLYRHMGPPDKVRAWSLLGRDKRSGGGGIPEKMCLNNVCLKSYKAHLSKCPWCGETGPEPTERGLPKMVAGEIALYDDEVLRTLRGEAAKIDGKPVLPYKAPMNVKALVLERHHEKVRGQMNLRKAMDEWARKQTALSQTEIERLFFYTFGMDALTAMTLNGKESEELSVKIMLA